VCNNSPAESTSPENGWRLSFRPILDRYDILRAYVRQVITSRRVVTTALKVSGENRPGAIVSVDLGGSSKYSSESLED
jgi:hypothetical protein